MKAYYLILSDRAALRINKPTLLFRVFAKCMGMEIFSTLKARYVSGIIISEWDKIKEELVEKEEEK